MEHGPCKAEALVGVGYIFRGRRSIKAGWSGRCPGGGKRGRDWKSLGGGQLACDGDRFNQGDLGGGSGAALDQTGSLEREREASVWEWSGQ